MTISGKSDSLIEGFLDEEDGEDEGKTVSDQRGSCTTWDHVIMKVDRLSPGL